MTTRSPKEIETQSALTLANETFDRIVVELDEPATVVTELAELLRTPPLPWR